jgi:uncharacterized protein with PIN domain
MFNRIREAIYEQSQQHDEFVHARNLRFAGEGRGLESSQYARCPTCDRATVLIEHEWTPQLSLIPSEQRDATYYTCEWCGSEIEPGELAERAPKKPAGRAGEDEIERARRIA